MQQSLPFSSQIWIMISEVQTAIVISISNMNSEMMTTEVCLDLIFTPLPPTRRCSLPVLLASSSHHASGFNEVFGPLWSFTGIMAELIKLWCRVCARGNRVWSIILEPGLHSRNSLLGTDSAVMASYLLHSYPGTGTEILVLPALQTALA